MANPNEAAGPFMNTLYRNLLERGISYFLPKSRLEIVGSVDLTRPILTWRDQQDEALELEWLGLRYAFSHQGSSLTENETKLLQSIGHVLSTRYRILFNASLAAQGFHLFRGLPEDRYVSAFLDGSPYSNMEAVADVQDRVAEAIEVLRVSSLTTYENRRIATGALLFGSHPDPCHALPSLPFGALPYSSALTAIRSFHRLCDGLQTVALVDRDGSLVELVDVQEWARPLADVELPVPSAARYQAHSRATLCGGHICLILTPNGEIKIFADGAQVFSFLEGRWRLTDAVEKYRVWKEAVGETRLAERLFTVALNLAEDRRGGLFVILEDAATAGQLVAASDLLSTEARGARRTSEATKNHLHYLLRGQRALDLAPAVLETVTRIDGAIVLDGESNLLSFGAILRSPVTVDQVSPAAEGSRTTAAIVASRFGKVLKISEDGLVSFFQDGQCIWEM
jgi:hypothetical protein